LQIILPQQCALRDDDPTRIPEEKSWPQTDPPLGDLAR